MKIFQKVYFTNQLSYVKKIPIRIFAEITILTKGQDPVWGKVDSELNWVLKVTWPVEVMIPVPAWKHSRHVHVYPRSWQVRGERAWSCHNPFIFHFFFPLDFWVHTHMHPECFLSHKSQNLNCIQPCGISLSFCTVLLPTVLQGCLH